MRLPIALPSLLVRSPGSKNWDSPFPGRCGSAGDLICTSTEMQKKRNLSRSARLCAVTIVDCPCFYMICGTKCLALGFRRVLRPFWQAPAPGLDLQPVLKIKLYTDCNVGFPALSLRQLKAGQMRHRFLPFPCLRLVRSGTASGGSRILSAEIPMSFLTTGQDSFVGTRSSSLIFQHSTSSSIRRSITVLATAYRRATP